MKFQKIVDDIYRLGVNIEDENYLFEGNLAYSPRHFHKLVSDQG